MDKLTINICTQGGSPLDRRTWSGTPMNICNHLKRQNNLRATFSVPPNKLANRLINILSMFLYFKNDSFVNQGYVKRNMNTL